MGLTPMEGLVMGTRSGDIDPGVITYLWRTAKMSVEEIETMLNRHAGMLGLGGEIDFRVVHQCIESGDEAAQLAYDVYIHRLRKYIGAYLALLGTADVITFTAGVGENDAAVRRDALTGMAALGHRARRTPQRQLRQGSASHLSRQLPDHGAGDSDQRRAGDRPRVRGGDLTMATLDRESVLDDLATIEHACPAFVVFTSRRDGGGGTAVADSWCDQHVGGPKCQNVLVGRTLLARSTNA